MSEETKTVEVTETVEKKEEVAETTEKKEEVVEKKEETTEKKEGDDEEDAHNDEEEVLQGDWILPQNVQVTKEDTHVTGEEDEEEFWSHRSKLYRFVNGEWKERGLGDAKLLQHKESKKIRFLLRQEKTLKIVANHYVVPRATYCKMTTNAGNSKIYVWTAPDCAEVTPVVEQFGLRFGTEENAKAFHDKFVEACAINDELFPKDL